MLRSLATAFCAALLSLSASGQGNQIIFETVHARTLRGNVLIGSENKGLPQVKVEECDQKFLHCSEVAKTTEDGSFAVASKKHGSTHYLRFLLLNVDEQRAVVVLDPKAGLLKIKMQVGT